MYVNFIGTDGSGKDTIFDLVKGNFPKALLTKEPGGTPEAEIIRSIILEKDWTVEIRLKNLETLLESPYVNPMTIELLSKTKDELERHGITGIAESLLYAAARSESLEKSIVPALEKGLHVLGRRSVACSVSYQGNARNLGMENIWELNYPIVKNTMPDLEIFFDLPIPVAMERLLNRTEKQDRLDLEKADFFERVREGYLYYYRNICPYKYVIIDATKSIDEVHRETELILEKEFSQKVR